MPKAAFAKYDHYRPHERVQEDGGKLNHVTGEVTYPPSRTKQAMQAECDINNIIKQFKTSGMVTHVNAMAQVGAYLDLPDDTDYQVAMNTVLDAQHAFSTLPAKVRSRFENDPAEFLAFMADAANQDEAIALGLATDSRPSSSSSSSSSSSAPPEKPPQEVSENATKGSQPNA